MYLLGATTFHMLYGRFSDVIGRKTCLYVAIFIFMLGNLAAGFSTTLIQLLILRAISGVGGGKIFSFYHL
jgi:MFS family permease